MHDDPVTDDRPDLPVAFDRLVAAGLSQERIEQHLAAGRVRVDGEPVTDPDRTAPPPARVVLWAE
jgi:16S rRNA U516 pseudouridylate synthase RsuA-like enzyme